MRRSHLWFLTLMPLLLSGSLRAQTRSETLLDATFGDAHVRVEAYASSQAPPLVIVTGVGRAAPVRVLCPAREARPWIESATAFVATVDATKPEPGETQTFEGGDCWPSAREADAGDRFNLLRVLTAARTTFRVQFRDRFGINTASAPMTRVQAQRFVQSIRDPLDQLDRWQ